MFWIYVSTVFVTIIALGGFWLDSKGLARPTLLRGFLTLVVLGAGFISVRMQLQELEARETEAQRSIESADATITLLRKDSIRTADILARTDTIANRALAAEDRAEARAQELQSENKALRSQLSDVEARLHYQTLQLSLAQRPELTNPTAQFNCYCSMGPSGFDLSSPCGTSTPYPKGLRWSLRIDFGAKWRTTIKDCDCDSLAHHQDLFPGTTYHPTYEDDINTGLEPYVTLLCQVGRLFYTGLFVGSTYNGRIPPSNIYNYCLENRINAQLTLEFPVTPSQQDFDSLTKAWKPMMRGADIRICLNAVTNEYLVVPLENVSHFFDKRRKQADLYWSQSALPRVENSEMFCLPATLSIP